MEAIQYRGKIVTGADISFIRRLIEEHPDASRFALSKKLCVAWNWVQPNGQLRDMVCRSLMLKLHRDNLIQLPPPRFNPPNNAIARRKPEQIDIDSMPISAALSEIKPLVFYQVRHTEQEVLFNSLIQEHHYLGYVRPIGEHLKYLVYTKERPVACFAWSSATRRLGVRDRFIGWSPQARQQNLHYLAYNTRFLILPWVSVPHLASHLLGRMVKLISGDWERFYGHPLYYLESFVDSERFAGANAPW